MHLQFSSSGRPYIQFDDGGIFIFSEETSSRTHYKYLIYSGLSTSTFTATVSAGKGKGKKKVVVSQEPLHFFVPFTFKGIPREAKSVLDEDDLENLKDCINQFLEGEMFPKSKLVQLNEALELLDAEE